MSAASKFLDWVPLPDQLEVAPPSLADLLAGRACARWLEQRVAQLAASPTLIEGAAAVGLVVRLWEPAAADGIVYKAHLPRLGPMPFT
jgi:hypothetical protein